MGIAGGGLLGYAIGHIKGGLPSWKYEFLIIGYVPTVSGRVLLELILTRVYSALCSAWGVVMFLVLPDSPVTARFLSKDERKLAVERLRADQTGIENKTLKPYQILEAFKDYKTYFFFALATVANIPNGGISNFGIEPSA